MTFLFIGVGPQPRRNQKPRQKSPSPKHGIGHAGDCLRRAVVAMMQTAESLTSSDATGDLRTNSARRCFLSQSEMSSVFVVQVDNATLIVMNCEKSVTLGILGTLALWWSTKLSPGIDELCSGAASMRTHELSSWRSRNGCSIRWPAALCAWRRCPRSAAMHCWI